MLKYMLIHHYTVADHIELDLQQGMTVITGETGAGKSIMIDALSLCLGARADTHCIRTGHDQLDIMVQFDISTMRAVQAWLEQHELSSDNECILRRIVKKDGRSLSLINGRNIPLQLTRELAEYLVTIHGQHEQQALFKRETHRVIIDNYGKHNDLLNTVHQHFQVWKSTQHEIEKLISQVSDQTRIDFIRYQLQELNDLHLQEGELAVIEQQHHQLLHADLLIENCQRAVNLIKDNEQNTITLQLRQSIQFLDKLVTLNSTHELLKTALINCEEAAAEIQQYLTKIELNPQRLQELEERLKKIYDVARKHRIKPQQILEQQRMLENELLQLTERDILLEKLNKKLSGDAEIYFHAARELTIQRKKIAKSLSKKITESIRQLGMPQADFEIQVQTIENETPQLFGMETIEFFVVTIPGATSQPLRKIVSGGELSRISLAIQVIAAQTHDTPTLLFDEVDVGIGGATAETVGKLLRKLGEKHQVICVTHQAQVAAQGHNHLRVEKIVNDASCSRVSQLSIDEKIEEIARMMGGKNITAQTRAHAKEMIAEC